MQKIDEDALICDYAETYHIYDYKGLPARYAAVLACGLGAETRIRQKEAGIETTVPAQVLQAQTLDVLRMILWALSGDKKHKPQLISEMLFSMPVKTQGDLNIFADGEAFLKAREKIIKERHNGN